MANSVLRVDRVLQTAGGILLFIVGGMATWSINMTLANSQDILRIQETRFTSNDGLKLANALDKLRSDMEVHDPPRWVTDRMEANNKLINEVLLELKELRKEIAALKQQ